MATLRQYFETDFSNAVRFNVSFKYQEEVHEGVVMYDLVGYSAFIACYVQGGSRSFDYFLGFIKTLQYGGTPLIFPGPSPFRQPKLFQEH
jgi:hypothetical protein